MLLMVAMTLAPTWAFGTEAAPAAQSGAQESQAAAVETSGAAEPVLAKLSVKAYQYAAGDPAKPLKAEASASDGGTLTYQWQSSKDGKELYRYQRCYQCGIHPADRGSGHGILPRSGNQYGGRICILRYR